MPKITSVEPQKKKPHRFNIFLDGEFAFGADEDLVVDRRLVPDKLLDTSEVEQLLFESEVGKLMEKMYRLFNIRQRSEKEVRDYFRIKNYESRIKGKEEISDLVVDSVVNRLKHKNMVNDEQFARSWMESRLKKYGPRKIKQELYKKGIDREIIDEVIGSGFVVSDNEVAQKLLEKKLERWKNLSPQEFKKKAYEFLLRRGFEYDMVKNIVDTSVNSVSILSRSRRIEKYTKKG